MSIELVISTVLPTPWATFDLHGFEDSATGENHIAVSLGQVNDGAPVLCRLHSECLTGDALQSLRCDCGPQLEAALQRIAKEGRGVLLYLRQEGRGIGLINKLRAYALQDKGADTVEANHRLGFQADMRDFTRCGEMLRQLGIGSVRLMTNNPAKIDALERAGITVAERVPLLGNDNVHNQRYLRTKAKRLGHLLDVVHVDEQRDDAPGEPVAGS